MTARYGTQAASGISVQAVSRYRVMRFPWLATAAIGAALTVLPALRARADVLINTIGVSDNNPDPLAPGALDPTGTDGGPVAVSFSTGGQGLDLSSLTLVLAAGNPNDGGSVVVSLWSDNPTGGAGAMPAPGSSLDTLGTINDSSLSTSYADVSVPITSAIALAANSRYWIELLGSSNSTASWANISGTTAASLSSAADEYQWNNYYGNLNSSALSTQYGIDMLTVSAVPEPASLFLFGAACVFLACARPRRAIRV